MWRLSSHAMKASHIISFHSNFPLRDSEPIFGGKLALILTTADPEIKTVMGRGKMGRF